MWLHYTFLIFLNTTRDFDKSYIINHVVYFGLKFQNIHARSALLTVFKCLVRNHFDYDDITHDQAFNNSFHQKIESIQYNAALAITGAISGTSTKKMINN